MRRGLFLVLICGGMLSIRAESPAPSNNSTESQDGERHSASAYQTGRTDAERDIRANRLAIEVFGMPGPWFTDYAKLLAKKYDIELRTVAGCVVDSKIVGHARGYNEVSEAEITRRFGPDVLENARAEARKR